MVPVLQSSAEEALHRARDARYFVLQKYHNQPYFDLHHPDVNKEVASPRPELLA
jgi:hypothetical protein